MTAASLPGAEQAPSFANAAECKAWLAAAPLTDAPQMMAAFMRELKAINRSALPAGDRLDILELLRGPVYETQEGFSRRFIGKLQPMAALEQSAYEASGAVWHSLVTGYMRCAEACFANDAQVKPRAALVLERALAALVAEQAGTHRVSRTPSGEHWRILHQIYATAEQLGVTDQEVVDTPHHGKLRATPKAVYVEALLLGVSNLHEHSQRQIDWVSRWARRWAPKVKVMASAPEFSSQAIPLCVDLGSDAPAGYKPFPGPGARWLDTVDLRHSLKKRLVLLAQGEPPAKLHLGDDCTQPACEEVLNLAYHRWCKGAAVRSAERRPASGPCRFIAGFEGIHYYVGGRKPLKQLMPKDSRMLAREAEEIATFGRVATHRDEHFSEQKGYAVEEWETLENWHMVNTSSAGMRIARPVGQNGVRLALRQLVAVSPADTQDWLLGCVRWTLVEDSFEIGLHFFAGKPEAIALRGAGLASASEVFKPGFLVPAVPAIKQDPSLVMPVGIFKQNRVLDIYTDGKPGRVRLTHLVERGADFERSAYEPA
ncbi:MAG TPA: hypothetical protein VF801_01565 [Rhodocyclaceae bacterium]